MKTPMPLDFGEVLLRTNHLRAEEFGALVMLLLCLWHRDGEVDYDLGDLQRMSHVDERRWPDIWESIRDQFSIADGKVRHPWITRDLGRVRGGGHLSLAAPSAQKMRGRWDRMKPVVRPVVFERDGYRCLGCGSSHNLTVDHIRPIRLGGNNELSNLQTLCRSCNSRKGTSWPASE